MSLKPFLSLLLLAFLTSCGGGANPDRDALNVILGTQNVSGEKFVILSFPDTLIFGDGTLSGTGSVRFAEDLGGVETGFNYALTFTLQESGELTLVSHAHISLENGVEIKFRRTGGTLSVFASASGTTDDWSSFFNGIDASAEMRLGIDLHNDEAITHIIFWNDLVSSGAEILNSARDVDGSPGKGYGRHWGLKLSKAEVRSVVRGEPRDGH